MSDKKMLFGFLAGIAAGAGIYAFLKSEKGKEIVDAAKSKADEWQDDLEVMMEKGKKMVEDFKEKMTDHQTTT